MSLTKRLRAVTDMVLPCETVCDIGCDHGYVSIALIKEKVASKVIACDVNKGPLEACKKNVERDNLSFAIETRLSDGLKKIKKDDKADCVVIAGMGGRLMTRILEEGDEIVEGLSQMVLQPQSELFLVRQYVRKKGFYIEKEKILEEDGKYYFVMDVRKGEYICKDLENEEVFDMYSEYLIQTKDEVLIEYLKRGLLINEGYLKGLSGKNSINLNKECELMKRALLLAERG